MAKKNRPESEFPDALSSPAVRGLVGAGYTRLEQLDGVSEKAIEALHGIGANAIKTLKAAMAQKGLSFSE